MENSCQNFFLPKLILGLDYSSICFEDDSLMLQCHSRCKMLLCWSTDAEAHNVKNCLLLIKIVLPFWDILLFYLQTPSPSPWQRSKSHQTKFWLLSCKHQRYPQPKTGGPESIHLQEKRQDWGCQEKWHIPFLCWAFWSWLIYCQAARNSSGGFVLSTM